MSFVLKVFKYLGYIIACDNCNTPAIKHNLKRARKVWDRISNVITKKQVAPKIVGIFYQAVVAAVLLYSSKYFYTTGG